MIYVFVDPCVVSKKEAGENQITRKQMAEWWGIDFKSLISHKKVKAGDVVTVLDPKPHYGYKHKPSPVIVEGVVNGILHARKQKEVPL